MDRGSLGVPPPPPAQERPWRVIYPLPRVVHDLTFLDDRPWGITTHWRPAGPWGSARSVACTGEGCEGCGAWRIGWSGYIPVFDHRHGTGAALAVTEPRYHGLRAHLAPGETICGGRWLMYHVQGANHGFRTWERSGSTPYFNIPAHCPNLLPTLRKLYPEVAHLLTESAEYDLGRRPL